MPKKIKKTKKIVKKRKPAKKKIVKKRKPVKKKVVKKRKPVKKKIVKPIKKKKIIKRKPVKKKIARPIARPIKRKKAKKKPVVFEELVPRTKIRIIGVGGGGGSIISEIVSRVKKADFVVANTDAKALSALRRVRRFQFGQNLTKGLGTGMNTEIGEMAAQEEKEKIKKLFEDQDICIIISSLGGGAGSGATPVFAKISRRSGCITYGIFTMPFLFEGEKKMEIAKEALSKIKPHLNAFSVIPNERIFQIIDKNTPLKDALSAINQRLAKNLQGLIEMIYSPGLINIDFADLKSVLSGRGKLVYLNTIDIRGPEKEEAVKKVISTPLYEYTIKGAKGILYNMVGSKSLQLSEVSKLSEIISNSVNKNAKIIFGIGQDQKNQNKIKITLLATGCKIKGFLTKPRIKRSKPKPKPKPKPKIRRKPRPKSQLKVEPKKVEPKKKVIKKPKLKPQPKPAPKPMVKPKSKPKVKPRRKPKVRRPKPEQSFSDVKERRNALQVRKVIEQEEKELIEQEKIWETPAIFRRKQR